MGVSDVDLCSIETAIAGRYSCSDIRQATESYLSVDPTDPALIGSYRYNMVIIPEARWHLGVVLGKINKTSPASYTKVGENLDFLMTQFPKEMEVDSGDDEVPFFDKVPPFSPAEVKVIVDEGLEGFSSPELKEVVRVIHPIRLAN